MDGKIELFASSTYFFKNTPDHAQRETLAIVFTNNTDILTT